jgi:arylsulfatase A-like enzyme
MPVSRRHFLLGSLALPALAAKKTLPDRPNVVLILVDYLPSWMLGCYGNNEVKTPNIDKLAQTGTRFHNHFAATPQAAISRATILTGRTPMQIGPAGTVSGSDIEKILGGAGYQCHATGKLPGADVTAAAVKLLDQQASGKPFLLTVSYSDLTPPYDGTPQKFVDLYSPSTFVNYVAEPAAANARAGKEMLRNVDASLRKAAAAISCIDDNIGGVIAKLYQKQLVDNTLVLFTSTCGSLFGRHGLWDSGDASDPVNMFDEVVQVPMIWSWAHRFPPLGVQVEMVSTYDLAPTLGDLLSLETPDNLCGRSYLLLAEGKKMPKKHPWRTTVCGHYQTTDMAREERYKVVLRNDGKGPNELYDLSVDPREKTNQYENGQYVDVRTRLQGEVTRWKQRFSS